MAKRVALQSTHVVAYIQEGIEVESVHIFRITHITSVDLHEAFKAAFVEWSKMDEGMAYFKSLNCDRGTNWGDILEIPKKVLKAHGIMGIATMNFKNQIVVNHDEILCDTEEVEIKIPIDVGDGD